MFIAFQNYNAIVTTLALGSHQGKDLQGCMPKRSLGVTSHAPRNLGECKGMNLHTLK
jgi:hypothetical protein